MFEGGRKDAEEMRRVCVSIMFILFCSIQDALASITVDLHCQGITRIINNDVESHRENYSKTFSFRDGATGVMKWDISDSQISYVSPTSFPIGDYALIYEKIDHSININRLSGDLVERIIFTIHQKFVPGLGRFRYQISEGRCKTAKQKF